jgi:hypothetical protein
MCPAHRTARASQEFVGVILALALLVVEVADFVNWSREAYHRRLTMRAPSEAEPPLYPIPGTSATSVLWRYVLCAVAGAVAGACLRATHTTQLPCPPRHLCITPRRDARRPRQA